MKVNNYYYLKIVIKLCKKLLLPTFTIMLKDENQRRVRINLSVKKSTLKNFDKVLDEENKTAEEGKKLSRSRDVENYMEKRKTKK